MKGRYTFRRRISTSLTQIDTQETVCITRRNDELLHGVTGYYGMVQAFISYHMCVANQGFRIIGLCTAYSGPKSSRFKADLEEA
ncbi:hypothetical protein M8C21_001406 [Ambrosia artemisiifolia]|uniref:Uncharacterized protein n=1 Tax=Ambrosia artemisiifolia TaxID=4212 RepID=A0AAD5C3A9_AMBAR|nr:hypothetical protein M8C21_001406 [Ambrosia artemisiifolia]